MRAPDHMRLENQTRDAARRLTRTAALPALTAVLNAQEGLGVGVAWAAEDMTLGEIEFIAYILLKQLSENRADGARNGCEDCAAAKGRIDLAVAALLPGFVPGLPATGRC